MREWPTTGIQRLFDDLADIIRLREEQPWRKRAACRGKPTEMFFPGRHDTTTLHAALRICKACPVRDACATASAGEQQGVWGGRIIRRPWRRRTSHAELVGVNQP